jgi:polygalacturonase
MILFLLFLQLFIYNTNSEIINFKDMGAIPNNNSFPICQNNTNLLNNIFSNLHSNNTLIIPNETFGLNGGVYSTNLNNITIIIDGTLIYQNNRSLWPHNNSIVNECMVFEQANNITITSNNLGIINGNGNQWWGAYNYFKYGENRPRLLHIKNSSNILIENLLLKDSPYWTFYANDVSNLEIRNTDIDARRTQLPYHSLYDLTAFNTDGFDVRGKNIHIHDVNIWTQDDTIAVKSQNQNNFQSQCSENMLFERINASGVGLTIGSIGPSYNHSCIRNITFKDCTMHNTFKGIYMKSRPGPNGSTGEITNILYDNITIINATQWAVWIGPQQAIYPESCSLFWPFMPLSKCYVPSIIDWENITLKDISIINPSFSPGVILGNDSNPIKNLTFNNVVVYNSTNNIPWGNNYMCSGVLNGNSIGNTNPSPSCFMDEC